MFRVVNTEKTKYIFTSHNQIADENYNTRIPNESFENVIKSKYFGMVNSENCIQEEMRTYEILGRGYSERRIYMFGLDEMHLYYQEWILLAATIYPE
jgi:hypothetical protein